MKEIKKIGIVINYYKDPVLCLGYEILDKFRSRGIQVLSCGRDAEVLGMGACDQKTFNEQIDLLLAIGGDGTMLRAARLVYGYETPILGINRGYLGFLAELEVDELDMYIDQIMAGDFYVETRTMLCGRVYRHNSPISVYVALNDLVVKAGSFARMIGIEVLCNGKPADKFSGDGVIISTGTGSTGYSLAAGGPIVSPVLDVLLLTPICPHALTSRPIIFPSDSMLKISIRTDTQGILTIDGQQGIELEHNDELIIHKAQFHTCLVKIKNVDFFQVMREKFNKNTADKFQR